MDKFSISNGLMRMLREIFFSSSSCSFVLLRSIAADERLPCAFIIYTKNSQFQIIVDN